MRLGLLGRILIPVVTVVAVASGVTAWLGGRTVADHLLKIAEVQLGTAADSQALRLSEWSAGARRDLSFWSGEAVFIKSTNDDFIGQQARKSAGDRLALLQKAYPGFDVLSLVDRTGLVIASSSPEAVGKLNVGDRDYITEALAGREALSAAFVSKRTKRAVFTISCPVRQGGQVVGAFYAAIDVANFSAGLTATASNTADAYTFVFDGSGRLIAHPVAEYLVNDEVSLDKLPFGAALRANTGGRVGYAFKGIDKLAAVREVAGTPWLLCRSVELSSVYAPVQRLQRMLLLLAGASVVLISVAAWVVSANIARPVRRTAAILDAVAGGDLSQQPLCEGGRELEAMNGSLACALVGMRSALGADHVDWAAIGRQTLARKELVERLASASRELGATGAQLAASAEAAASQATTVGAAAEEVSRSVQTVSAGTEEMSSAIAEIARTAG